MDVLHTCYQSYMRLYPDDPDRLTLGRWAWCPEGAEYLPFEHSFQSSKWDPFSWRVDPDVGEVRGLVGYSSGKITPRFTGRTFCGAVILYQEGSPLDLMGTPAVDEDGVPLCCAAPPAVGGLALGGGGIVSSWADVAVWLKGESIAELADLDLVHVWPDSGLRGNDGVNAGDNAPTKSTDPDTGLTGAIFGHLASLGWSAAPINNAVAGSVYMVATGIAAHGQANMRLVGAGSGLNSMLTQTATGFIATNNHQALSWAISQPHPGLNLMSFRQGPTGIALAVNGVVRASGSFNPAARIGVFGLACATTLFPLLNAALLFEIIAWDRLLSDQEDAAVTNYLLTKYLPPPEPDVITGSVIAFAGSTIPTGYLACDGSAVSRTGFAALFAAVGTTWGAGDGSTTFNLPDLRGRAGIGAGTGSGLSPRTLADLGGQEDHTLLVNEIPAHSHPIADPGHNHSLPSSGFNASVDNASPSLSVPDTSAGTSGTSTTNLSVGNTGDDDPHNNMQPFAVIQYLIKS